MILLHVRNIHLDFPNLPDITMGYLFVKKENGLITSQFSCLSNRADPVKILFSLHAPLQEVKSNYRQYPSKIFSGKM